MRMTPAAPVVGLGMAMIAELRLPRASSAHVLFWLQRLPVPLESTVMYPGFEPLGLMTICAWPPAVMTLQSVLLRMSRAMGPPTSNRVMVRATLCDSVRSAEDERT